MTTQAEPYDHDEVFHGFRLFECLTRVVPPIRHGPSNTSWVFGYRAVSPRGRSAMLFRPRRDLFGHAYGQSIIEDVGAHAISRGSDRECSWAAVVAPAGVRLRAITLELADRNRRLPVPVALDLVARTREALTLGRDGDTFIGWDGGVWLAPSFPAAWEYEVPSVIGNEVFDALTLDSAWALRQAITGRLSGPIFHPSLMNDMAVSPEIEPLTGNGEPFFDACAQIARPAVDPGEIGRIAKELFRDAYDRQAWALRRE